MGLAALEAEKLDDCEVPLRFEGEGVSGLRRQLHGGGWRRRRRAASTAFGH
jgi:hypothetical protein